MSDFYEPGVTYQHSDDVTGKAAEWRFRCDSVTTHPEDGARTALGWRYWNGTWRPYAYGDEDWGLDELETGS